MRRAEFFDRYTMIQCWVFIDNTFHCFFRIRTQRATTSSSARCVHRLVIGYTANQPRRYWMIVMQSEELEQTCAHNNFNLKERSILFLNLWLNDCKTKKFIPSRDHFGNNSYWNFHLCRKSGTSDFRSLPQELIGNSTHSVRMLKNYKMSVFFRYFWRKSIRIRIRELSFDWARQIICPNLPVQSFIKSCTSYFAW